MTTEAPKQGSAQTKGNSLNNNHWTMATYRQRMTVQQWREVLLAGDDCMVFKGNPCRLKAKNLGAGVVEVYKDIPANKED